MTERTATNVQLTNVIIPVTDDTPEPPRGSVVIVHGLTGTAYQRLYTDGLWHSTVGTVLSWERLKRLDNAHIILVGGES